MELNEGFQCYWQHIVIFTSLFFLNLDSHKNFYPRETHVNIFPTIILNNHNNLEKLVSAELFPPYTVHINVP